VKIYKVLRQYLRLFVLKSLQSSASKGICKKQFTKINNQNTNKKISARNPQCKQLVLSESSNRLKDQNFYKYNFQKL
jgi:hypothetical protein